MKHLKILSVILLLVLLIGNCNSQDTSNVKFFPLQVGNTYVYNWFKYVFSGLYRIKIIKDTISNGKKYFYVFGEPSYPNPHTQNFYCDCWLRIDSVKANIYSYFNNSECLFDSLASKINDTSNVCSGKNVCTDTALIDFSGNIFKSKTLRKPELLTGFRTTYIKNIGIFSASRFEQGPFYSLVGCVVNGNKYGDTTFPVGINLISSEIPKGFILYQNYPNPFNPATKIKFNIPQSVILRSEATKNPFITLKIFDILGNETTTLINERLNPGTYEVDFDGTNYTSGIYYYKLVAGDYSETKKMIIIK